MSSVRGVFVNATARRQFSAGEVLFNAGDGGTEMFGVISGAIELRRGDDVLATLGPDDTFGEMSLIDHSPRSLTAVASENSEIAVIDERVFLFLVHETPMFALQVMRTLADRVRELNERI
jgi:CRP/FNR family transcriptional regulator, cyclic AMP receptor protein